MNLLLNSEWWNGDVWDGPIKEGERVASQSDGGQAEKWKKEEHAEAAGHDIVSSYGLVFSPLDGFNQERH